MKILIYLKNIFLKKQNRVATSKFIFESQYLSGCFLVIKANIFDQINGFDERYFLHFEDADITRELSKIGKCIHFPYAKFNIDGIEVHINHLNKQFY